MLARPHTPENIVECLQRLARTRPQSLALTTVTEHGATPFTYADIAQRARVLGAYFQAAHASGARALLLMESGIDYVAAFFGCLYAGVIAVPVYPPESAREQHLARLRAIAADAAARYVLTTTALATKLADTLTAIAPGATSVAVDALDESTAHDWLPHTPADEAIAFLQYTSGSTAAPKGVMVSHGNLIANEIAIKAGLRVDDDDVFVSWLPLYHDMGLIGTLLQPIYSGIPLVLMSPHYFLERPVRWLETMSCYRGTISGGPDFAYRLCCDRVREEQLEGLDVSSWRVAFSGSEPVRHDTLAAFVATFAPIGFAASALYPCYGLAEATLFVTGGVRGEGVVATSFSAAQLAQSQVQAEPTGTTLVACGAPAAGHQIAIVDPLDGSALSESAIGEIWVAGPSVSPGYWQHSEATAASFVERAGTRWLRTGDLGFWHAERLYIAGRHKDMLIIRGQNLYPQDIERAIENEVEFVRKGRVAAFAVDVQGREGIGVAVEISRSMQKIALPPALVSVLNEVVSVLCGARLAVAVLLQPGALPKTSSGKLQRSATRHGWQARTLEAYAIYEDGHFVHGSDTAQTIVTPPGESETPLAAIWSDVLGRAVSSPEAHFFALGGNSLTAIQVVARVRETWAVPYSLQHLFEHPGLGAAAALIEQLRTAGERLEVAPILPRPTALAGAPLSYAQQRQWFLWQMQPASSAYHIAGGVRLQGSLDVPALQASFNALCERHAALRTTFVADADGQAIQVIHAATAVEVPLVDLRGAADPEECAAALTRQCTEQPFDLTTGPLLRLRVLQCAADDHLLLVVLHHIIADGWSMQVLINDLVTYYRAHVTGAAVQLPALPVQYADYALWQRHWLEAGEKERQLAYWQAQLGAEHPILALPTDQPRPTTTAYHAAQQHFVLPAGLSEPLQHLMHTHNVTLFMVLLAAFQVLLYRYTGQTDIRIGVPIANRQRQETEGLIGFFVNTQVLRSQLHGRLPLRELLAQVRQSALEAQAHQDIPFDLLVEALQPERSLSHTPLFQVLYNHLRRDYRALAQLPGLESRPYVLGEGMAQFELTLDTYEEPDGRLGGTLVYARELFEPATMVRLASHYQAILAAFVSDISQTVGDVALLSASEYAQVLSWGRDDTHYPALPPVHVLIEQQVERSPQAPAVFFEDIELTYEALNRRANQLAHHLIRAGVGPEVKVGLAVERSPAMIIGLLGILKAGGAFVPLDPAYPAERLQYMMADSHMGVLLTQSHIAPRLPTMPAVHVIELETATLATASEQNPAVPLHGATLAYVLYTSGSTGSPKGVAVSQRTLAEHTQAAITYCRLTASDRVLQFATLNFDGFIEQVYPPLCIGAALVLRGPELWDSATFYQALLQYRVSIADLPTVYWQALAQDFAPYGPRDYGALRQLHAGGEAMSPEGLRKWQEVGRQRIRLLNTYGPTETTVTATAFDCSTFACGQQAESRPVPIGRPLAGRTAYVLDTELNLVPPGVAGDLYLGGVGLARGYLHRPGLTAEQFVPHPCAAYGERLYRTGDLVRWRADGELEYLGRRDQQVKIRGFRIELGEIETHLLARPGVRDAVVVAQAGPSGARLVGYVTPRAETRLDGALLQTQLAALLPDYMVPGIVVVLAALPLGPTGKVDRQALPAPVWSGRAAYEAPQGEVEDALATIWRTVLRLDRVGRHDNFFELGGDSILSLQIVARARQMGWQLAPRQLFERQTIARLAAVAVCLPRPVAASSAVVAGDVPLLPLQSAFFQTTIPQRHHWNQAVLLHNRQPLEPALLRPALQALVQHHDALRLRYIEVTPGQWRQTYSASETADLLWVQQDQSGTELAALCQKAQCSLNLAQGPLLRAVAITLADGSQRLLLVIHHLVVDGVSWRLLLEDLQTAYQQLQANQMLRLPAKTSPYQAWAQYLLTFAHSAEVRAERDYWRVLAHTPATLPCDDPSGANTVRHAASMTLQLERAATQRLLYEAPAAYRTQVNDLLLTALGRALCRWSGQAQIRIDLEGHGREALGEDLDLSRTVGWFTSLYPVCLDPSGELGAALKRVKEALRQVPQQGLGFGLLRCLGQVDDQRALADLSQADVVFNYLGQFDGSFDAAALWQLATESAGPSSDPDAPLGHALSINGQIYNSVLELTLSYSAARYQGATIAAVIESYRTELLAILDHCSSGVRGLTPSDFPLAALTQAQLDALPLPPEDIEDLYPLAPLQAGMVFHSLYHPEERLYLNQLRLDIEGLEVARFQAAWQAIVARHDTLRTGFVQQGDTLLQWVSRTVEFPWTVHDWWEYPPPAAPLEVALEALAQAELQRGFDIAQPPLYRLLLVRTGVTRYHWVWTSHHVLLDGWSTAQLLAEVLRHYGGQALPVSGGRYRDYIAWLQRQNLQESEAYWRTQLAAFESPTRLAPAVPSAAPSRGYGAYHSELDATVTARLIAFAQQEHLTVNTLVQAAWALLLQRYTGQATVVFGATVAGRPAELPGIEQVLGLFINTLPIITTPRPEQGLRAWLQALQTYNLTVREHEHTPLYDIQRWAGQSGQELFDTIVVCENYPVDEVLQGATPGGLRFTGMSHQEETHYAMTVAVLQGRTLRLHYSYAQEQCHGAAIEGIATGMERLLQHFVMHPDCRLGDIPLLGDAEQAQVLAWGRNVETLPPVLPVHQVIERQAGRCPEAPAVLCNNETLTYAELNQRANRLAHHLIREGVGPEVTVGLVVARAPAMIVALLAILKAGGAYLPLDSTYPLERLQYMIQDSGSGVLLTQSDLIPGLATTERLRVLHLDTLALSTEVSGNPTVRLHSANLAYVIYTSGSTGRPKGVAVAHGPLSMHCQAIAALYGLSSADRVLQLASISVDAATEQWLLPLLNGATLVLRGEELWSPDRLVQEVGTRHLTVLDIPPAYLREVVHSTELARLSATTCIVGGEAWRRDDFAAARRVLPESRLINAYGPSEAVITPTLWRAESATGCDTLYVPIGRPVGERTAYVLDTALQVVPPGVSGELYLGGVGLARGYLHRPGLTAEHFVPDPFAGHGGRLYRTGDLVRWRADGALEYLGRSDRQIKIRGFRVEPGEVEAQLLAQTGVHEAVVVAQGEPGAVRLVGYVIPEVGAILESATLKARLEAALPAAMVPSALVVLEALPLLPNGKVDHQALPAPETAGSGSYEAPQGALEEALAAIWCDILGLARVGRQDNFFALGGHSLLAMRLISRVQAELAYTLPLRAVFAAPTLLALASQLPPAESGAAMIADPGLTNAAPIPPLLAVARTPVMPVSLAQQRLWLVDKLAGPGLSSYNMSATLRLSGDVSPALLHASLTMLVARHEVLRTAYPEQDGEPVAVIAPEVALEVPYCDLTSLSVAERTSRVQQMSQASASQPFDLAQAPLLRAALIRLEDDVHVFVCTVHHLVADGWSVSLFLDEFVTIYRALREHVAPDLAPLPVQYADYAVWQRQLLRGAYLEQELAFWRSQLAGAPTVPPWRTDFPRPAVASPAGDAVHFTVPLAVLYGVEALARTHNMTVFMVLLASFQLLLHQATGAADLVIGTDVAGRRHSALEGLVGFFVNVVPLRSRLAPTSQASLDFLALLQQAREVALEVFEHQDVPFDRIVEALNVPRDRRWNPLVQVLFVLQNTPTGRLDIPGLQIDIAAASTQQSKFDMALFVEPGPDGLSAEWVYATTLFTRATVQRFGRAWLRLLAAIVATPPTALRHLTVPAMEEIAVMDSSHVMNMKRNTLQKLVPKVRQGASAEVAPANPTRPLVKLSFLQAERELPVVVEPSITDLDPLTWAQGQRDVIDMLLGRHAAILFRHFELRTPQDFEAFVEAMLPGGLYGSYGDLPKKEGGHNIYRSTPYPERQMILYHNESSHLERWPRKQWFFCEQPSLRGGATPIVDCRELYRQLPPEIMATFERKQVMYVRTFTDKLDVSWRDFFRTDSRQEVEARCNAAGMAWQWLENDSLQTRTVCPAVITHPVTGERCFFNQVQLHHVSCLEPEIRQDLLDLVGAERLPRQVYYGDGTPIPDDIMAVIGRLYETCAVRFTWQQGDVLMLDNMLAAHARDPYEEPRKIVVAMGDMVERAQVVTPNLPSIPQP